MPDPETIEAVRRWLEFADGDLRSAEAHISHPDLPPRIACFLAQQAAEKALKAALVSLEKDFPWSHDLEELAGLLPDEWNIKTRIRDLAWLSEWAVEGRYPGDLPDATTNDANQSIVLARDTLQTVISDLKTRGF